MSTSPTETPLEITIQRVKFQDPRAEPLLAALSMEYTQRHADRFGGTAQEMQRYPAAEFAAPTGSLLLLVHEGQTIAGMLFVDTPRTQPSSNGSGPMRTSADGGWPARFSPRWKTRPGFLAMPRSI